MWSWAVTSLRLFGRLESAGSQKQAAGRASKQARTLSRTYYFSTQGWARGVSGVFFSCLPAPLAAAAFLALMSKKLAILGVGLCGPVWADRLSQEGERPCRKMSA